MTGVPLSVRVEGPVTAERLSDEAAMAAGEEVLRDVE